MVIFIFDKPLITYATYRAGAALVLKATLSLVALDVKSIVTRALFS